MIKKALIFLYISLPLYAQQLSPLDGPMTFNKYIDTFEVNIQNLSRLFSVNDTVTFDISIGNYMGLTCNYQISSTAYLTRDSAYIVLTSKKRQEVGLIRDSTIVIHDCFIVAEDLDTLNKFDNQEDMRIENSIKSLQIINTSGFNKKQHMYYKIALMNLKNKNLSPYITYFPHI